MNEILAAIEEARRFDPDVTTLVITRYGNWLFMTDEGCIPAFDSTVNVDILKAAVNFAYSDKTWPALYYVPLSS